MKKRLQIFKTHYFISMLYFSIICALKVIPICCICVMVTVCDDAHLFPTPYSRMSCWQLEFGHGGNISSQKSQNSAGLDLSFY